MKIKKKRMIIIGIVLAVIVIAGVVIWLVRGEDSSETTKENTVYVDSVAELCGLGSGNGLNDRFSGVVEPQKTWNIELPSDKKVDKILVKEGDEVKTGDKLFTYSTEEMEESLAQAEIDLDRLGNEVEQTKAQITQLKKEKAEASSDAQLSYTTQINSAENTIKKNEYEQKSKKVEINKLKNSIANATVISEMDGVVKTINATDNDSSAGGLNGETEAFMTILAVGDFRIKGTVNEQNMSAIVEGQPVIVHSRVNDTTWKGTLTAVDLENPEKDENAGYYVSSSSSDSSATNSSNYPFYVELESVDGLMLGQHVYIEMDYGQGEEKEGIWLDSYYIMQEEDKAYVWAATSKDKIEKREITLGEFDEELQKYQVTDGLTEDDYIAFPDETITEGAKAEKNVNQVPGGGMPGSSDGMSDNSIPSFDGTDGMLGGMDGQEYEGGEEYGGEEDYGDEENYEDEEDYGDEDDGSVGEAGGLAGSLSGMEDAE